MPDNVALFGPSPMTVVATALRQNLTLGQCPWFAELCSMVPVPIVILNETNTVVFANAALLRLAELPADTDLIGSNAETRRLTELGLVARPLRAAGEAYTVLTCASCHRRPTFERAFFHDLLNTAGGVHGLSQVMAKATPDELPLLTSSVRDLASQMMEEITAHRDLAAAESGELRVRTRPVRPREALDLAAARYRNHPVAADRQIVVVPGRDTTTVTTDPVILGRILGNMVKNALEAVPEGTTITLDSGRTPGSVWFAVQNPGTIAAEDLGNVFASSFSTKGCGRGLGTWSMRILAESYLRGRVTVASDAAQGTVFTLTLPADGP